MVSELSLKMASNNILQPQLPHFNSSNYNHWNKQIKVLFSYQNLSEAVEIGYVKPENQEILP